MIRRAFDHARMLAVALCLCGLALFGEYAVLRMAPADWWFRYESIRAVDTPAGGPLGFVSAVSYFRPVDITWRETLYCDAGDGRGFQNVSTQESAGYGIGPAGREVPALRPWQYTARVPRAPIRCFVRSTPTVSLRYGITKTQIVLTDEFRLKPGE